MSTCSNLQRVIGFLPSRCWAWCYLNVLEFILKQQSSKYVCPNFRSFTVPWRVHGGTLWIVPHHRSPRCPPEDRRQASCHDDRGIQTFASLSHIPKDSLENWIHRVGYRSVNSVARKYPWQRQSPSHLDHGTETHFIIFPRYHEGVWTIKGIWQSGNLMSE